MKIKSKIKDYILIVVMCIVCLWVYKNQSLILDKIIMLNPHYIELDVTDEKRDIITVGKIEVDIHDLVGAPGRAKEQGGATLIYELPTPCEAGQYYLRIKGYTKKYAGRMTISLYDDVNEKGYEGGTFFSSIPMEYNMVITADTDFTKIKLLWENTENVPSLTDFQLAKLPENQDIESMEIGVKPEEGAIETITLESADKVVDGEVTCAVARGDELVYAQENKLCTLIDGNIEESIERESIINLYVDYYENLYVIFENGDMDVRYKDGRRKTYDLTNFEQKPVDVLVAGDYMFVPEGYGGVEIFKVEDEKIRYLSKLFIDNRYYFSKVAVYNHSVYAIVNGNVEWFDIAYICNPIYKKAIYTGESARDIWIVDNKLSVVSNVTDNDMLKNGCLSGEKASGMTVYKIEYAGNVNVVGGYRTEYRNTVGANNINDYVTNPIESAPIRVLSEGELSEYDVINTLTGKSNIWIITDAGIYSHALIEEKRGDTRKNEKILTKERQNNYIPTYTSEDGEEFEVYVLEAGNIVKDAVILRDYYVIGTTGEIAVYDRKRKELLYKERVEWDHLDAFDIRQNSSRENILILSYGNRLILYEVYEEKLEEKNAYMLTIGSINGVYYSNRDEMVVYGSDGLATVAIINNNETLLDVVRTTKGGNIQGIATETENGYVVYNTEGVFFYWDTEEEDESLKVLRLMMDEMNNMEDEKEYHGDTWLCPSNFGYYVVYNQVMQSENGGIYMLHKPETQGPYYKREVLWSGFSILDTTINENGERLQCHRMINKIFAMNIENNTSDIQVSKHYVITLRNKLYDVDRVDKQIITAVGRDGAIIFEKMDK